MCRLLSTDFEPQTQQPFNMANQRNYPGFICAGNERRAFLMNNGETYFCAIDPTPGSTRAVLVRDGELLSRFLTSARGERMMGDFSDFLHKNLQKAGYFSLVIFTGYIHKHRWVRLKAFLNEHHGHPGLFQLELLRGPDIHQIFAMDTQFDDDQVFGQLELIAHLCSLRHNREPIGPPGKVRLDWMLNRKKEKSSISLSGNTPMN
jgi:hypothetical protein